MRILQISSARAMGGGERHLADLANQLTGRGHDVHAAISPGSPLAKELRALPKGNIATIPLRNALDAASALELARLISKKDIEIVHVHMARDYPLAAYATRRNRKSRLIITRHSCPLEPTSRRHSFKCRRVIAVSEAVAAGFGNNNSFLSIALSLSQTDRCNRFAEMRQKFDGVASALSSGVQRPVACGNVGEITQLKGMKTLYERRQSWRTVPGFALI